MKLKAKLDELSLFKVRRPSPHFQRAVNLKYDLDNPDYLSNYIPTPNATQAISALVRAIQPTARQRALVLHGPYGAGKSLLGTVIAALFSKDEHLYPALQPILARLHRDFPEIAELLDHYLREGPRLLPIILYGDEGPIASALTHALTRAMFDLNLGDHRPRTNYRAVLETINMWQVDYPATYEQLTHLLEAEGYSLLHLKNDLSYSQSHAYTVFLRLYPKLTAGATFDHNYRQSVIEAYTETLTVLKKVTPYSGIIILWDEFGRYLEGHAGEVFGSEVNLLQDFVEFCNSEKSDTYLTLITHKVLGSYAWGLSGEVEREWTRIAKRFHEIDVSGSDEVSYRLIAEALITTDEETWKTYLVTHHDILVKLFGQIEENRIFSALDSLQTQQWIIQDAYPLHPLTTYCLPRLSAQVAQNERTLFTFIAADEPEGLLSYLKKIRLDRPPTWIGLDTLFNYFAEAMKVDIAPGGVHKIWASADYALHKISTADDLAIRIIKSLAILQATQKSQVDLPTTFRLAFAVEEDQEVVRQTLHYLARRKLVLYAKATDSWELSASSIVDIEEHLRQQLDRYHPTLLQLRRLLEDYLPLEPYSARRHNHRNKLVRFFHNWYRIPSELHPDGWDLILKQTDYADGIIIYVLVTNTEALQQARAVIENVSNKRIIFVLPHEPLRIDEPLRELFALVKLNNDLSFKTQDDRIDKELAFYIDDVRLRLLKMLAPLIDPTQAKADWYWQGEKWEKYSINSAGRITRLLSDVCDDVFSETPIFNNEGFNVRYPTGQQVKAAEKVIDAFLINPIDDRLGLNGYGPDWLIIRTMLIAPGFLRQIEEENWQLGMPRDDKALQVWRKMEMFFGKARVEEQEFSTLINELQWEPYGLRLGILPLLLALALRPHLHITTVRCNRRPVLPIVGATFTHLCLHPDRYTLELGPETLLQAAVWSLLERYFGERVMPEERKHQPLRYLTLGMVRWLSSLPRFAQTAVKNISKDAQHLRQLILQAMDDPAQILFQDLPALLLEINELMPHTENNVDEGLMENRLLELTGELDNAYTELLYRLDRFAVDKFAKDSPKELWNGQSALSYWTKKLTDQMKQPLQEFQFSDIVAQNLVNTARSEIKAGNFWDTLAKQIVGTSPRDWDDQKETNFYEILLSGKRRVERELLLLTDEAQDIIEVTIQTLAEAGNITNYRLEEVELSEQGQLILENFKSTLLTSGRPLSLNEKRQIALEFLRHMLGNDNE